MLHRLNTLNALAVSVLRLGRGMTARITVLQPEKRLHLWEFESCAFCRKVRETLSELDLEFHSHPCPKGSSNRAEVVNRGGKKQFPFLEDPNTGVQMYESESIITYLHETYGTGRTQASQFFSPVNTLGSVIAKYVRPVPTSVYKAVRDRPSPKETLILYGFEASPYCRVVRETLGRLNLDFISSNVARNSPRRKEFVERSGQMMVPYLVDPNTGIEMHESQDIIRYLKKTYGPDA